MEYSVIKWELSFTCQLLSDAICFVNCNQVLWPECGWQPVSLTDLITGASVKKVYRKATLCIHPDKVQQKGANLQQKYIAEKVFDLLKVLFLLLNPNYIFSVPSIRCFLYNMNLLKLSVVVVLVEEHCFYNL